MATKRRMSVNDDNNTPKPKFNQKLPNQPKSKPAPTQGKSKPVGGMKPDGGTPNGPKGGSKGAPQYKMTDPNFPGYKKRTQDPQQKPRTLNPSQGRGRGKAVPPRPTSKSNNKPGPWDDIARGASRAVKGAKLVGKGYGKMLRAEGKFILSGPTAEAKVVAAGAKAATKAASATAKATRNVAKNAARGYGNVVRAEQRFVKAGAKTGVKAVKTGAKLLMKPVQPVKTQPMKKRSASSTSTKKK